MKLLTNWPQRTAWEPNVELEINGNAVETGLRWQLQEHVCSAIVGFNGAGMRANVPFFSRVPHAACVHSDQGLSLLELDVSSYLESLDVPAISIIKRSLIDLVTT